MIERVRIADIRIGNRRRQDLGDIESLARNIDEHGLIHPIVITDEGELIAGERRLRACEALGLTEIEARRWRVLSEAERREIELAENLDRKDLTALERSRTLADLAEIAAEVDETEYRLEDRRNSVGRPPEPGSLRRVADRIGVDKQTISNATRHVAAVDAYPELRDYAQDAALKIAGNLNEMAEEERTEARSAIMRHDPEVIAKLADKPPLPKTPPPAVTAKQNPSWRLWDTFHTISMNLNAIRNHPGGILAITDAWPQNQRDYLRESIRETQRQLSDIAAELDGKDDPE